MYLHYILYIILLLGLRIVLWYLAAHFKISESPNFFSQIIITVNLGGKSYLVLHASPRPYMHILFLFVFL